VSEGSIFEFTVSGHGVFPYDMLRYDRCWPATEDMSAKLSWDPRSVRAVQQRAVTMKGTRLPTIGRWHSFGWHVGDAVETTARGNVKRHVLIAATSNLFPARYERVGR